MGGSGRVRHNSPSGPVLLHLPYQVGRFVLVPVVAGYPQLDLTSEVRAVAHPSRRHVAACHGASPRAGRVALALYRQEGRQCVRMPTGLWFLPASGSPCPPAVAPRVYKMPWRVRSSGGVRRSGGRLVPGTDGVCGSLAAGQSRYLDSRGEPPRGIRRSSALSTGSGPPS